MHIAAPVAVVFDLARDIDLHIHSMRAAGERAVAGRTSGLIELGETVTWRAKQFGFSWTLTSRVTVFEPPNRFVDEQFAGPFAWFRHEHRFDAADHGTVMTDLWEHRLRFGFLGEIVDHLLLARLMARLLHVRASAIKHAAEDQVLAIPPLGPSVLP